MVKKLFHFMLIGFLVFSVTPSTAQPVISFDKYHTNKEVQQMLEKLQQGNPSAIKLHEIATSPGGEPVQVLEIGANLNDVPAIFVGANFEGDVPLSTEGALYMAKMLLDSAGYTKNLKWYIMPLPNPDAANGFFSEVKQGLAVNRFQVNDDADEATNEDGFDDLNNDGLITKMRVKDLQGTHVVSKTDPRILTPADSKKSERGEYKIYSEGIDNDGDGTCNEDGVGGINVGIGFPHLFPHNKKEAGLFSGQTPEVYGILGFMYARPAIAMVYTLGSSNFCAVPPQGGRKGDVNLQNIQIPERYATRLGVDPTKTFTMDEVIEMMKTMVPPGMEVTPELVAGFLGLGAAVNPLEDDLKFYTRFSEDYKKYLEGKKFNAETLSPTPAKDGSFELWAYYHLGVPSFSMNLFTVPKVKEEKKTGEGALSLDDVEKIPKPEKENELSEKDKALLAWSDSHWGGKGFVDWEIVDHPALGEVEIGGYVPYLETTPKPELIDSMLKTQLPWLLQLTKNMPEISIAKEEITAMGAGIYKLEIYVENKGYLPYPIAIGSRNKQPAPVIVTLDGNFELLEGIKRTPLGSIGGNQVKKLSWMIKSEKKTQITAKVESAVFTDNVKQINIGG